MYKDKGVCWGFHESALVSSACLPNREVISLLFLNDPIAAQLRSSMPNSTNSAAPNPMRRTPRRGPAVGGWLRDGPRSFDQQELRQPPVDPFPWRFAVDRQESTSCRSAGAGLDSSVPRAEQGVVGLGRPGELQHSVRRSRFVSAPGQRRLQRLRQPPAAGRRCPAGSCSQRPRRSSPRPTGCPKCDCAAGVLVHLVRAAVDDPDILTGVGRIDRDARRTSRRSHDRPTP